jgi:uncharacterized protein YggE
MKNILAILLLGFIALPALSQEFNDNSKPYIEVYGTAEKEITPNEIFISVSLKEKSKSRDSETLEKQIFTLKKRLSEIGIPEELISMADAGANYIKVSWKQKDVISSANFTILVATAKEVASVFQIFDELDIHGAHIKHTSHSDIVYLRKKVRIEAIKAAKEKAAYLLEAIGHKPGNPLLVSEVSRPGIGALTSNVVMNEPRQTFQSKQGGAIQFRKIKIQSSILVKFEIQ